MFIYGAIDDLYQKARVFQTFFHTLYSINYGTDNF